MSDYPVLLKDANGQAIPQAFDETLDGGNGDFTPVTPDMIGGAAPLAALSGNIPDTTVPTGSANALPAGACARGVWLQAFATNADAVRWGAVGVGATSGGRLEPGDYVFVPVANSSVIFVISATASQKVAGVRI